MSAASNGQEPNPLLCAPGLELIPTWLTDIGALMNALEFNPLAGLRPAEMSKFDRVLQVDDLKRIFVPAPQPARVAQRMLRALYQGLRQRNPRLETVRRDLNALAQHLGKALTDLPWFPNQAVGIVLEGITGIGKSHIADRVLSLLPQVIVHEPKGDWGMHRLKQLIWLKVPMPADHSRKGLLINCIKEIDRALGTNYEAQHVKTTVRVEFLIVTVMYILAQHRCGLLVIEESQAENLGSRVFSRDFLNYFLRILNWGIPVMLIGNPLAFEQLRLHAQDVDRFSEGGWFTMLPAFGPDAPIWRDIWMPRLWGPSLMDKPDAAFEALPSYPAITSWDQLIWRFTGGLPRLVCRLRIETLDDALSNDIEVITTSVVASVFEKSPAFTASRERIKALATHDFENLWRYKDLPVSQLRMYWTPKAEQKTPDIATEQTTPRTPSPPPAASPSRQSKRAGEASPRSKLCRDISEATEVNASKRKAR
ncbi:ATP-binding protein [Roseateles flavus]|uniref:ATP-binding protein n=1 Tax=Roseateles flavus TaxID=3149041 RepID=A0ABV0GKB2_9BURK